MRSGYEGLIANPQDLQNVEPHLEVLPAHTRQQPRQSAELERLLIALQASDERARLIAEGMPQIVWTALPNGELDFYNQRWYDYTGMTLEQTYGWGWAPVLHPDDLQNCIDRWTMSYTTGAPYEVEYRFLRASDGSYRWHLGRAAPMRNEKGEILFWVGTCTDIEDQKRAVQALHESWQHLEERVRQRTAELEDSEARYRAHYEKTPVPTFTWRKSGDDFVFESYNPAADEFTSGTAAALVGQPASEMYADTPEVYQDLGRALTEQRVVRHEMKYRLRGIDKRCDLIITYAPIAPDLVIAQLEDVTERNAAVEALRTLIAERTASLEAVKHQSLHDILTELPNRTLLHDRLDQAIANARRRTQSMALLFLDLDRFKQVNDTLGHRVGDLLLKEVASRLRGLLRESDTVARMGGDEFAIVLPAVGHRDAEAVAEKLLRALDEPICIDGHRLELGTSIGAAIYPEHGEDAESLMRHADVAMYVAKRGGLGQSVYAPAQAQNDTT